MLIDYKEEKSCKLSDFLLVCPSAILRCLSDILGLFCPCIPYMLQYSSVLSFREKLRMTRIVICHFQVTDRQLASELSVLLCEVGQGSWEKLLKKTQGGKQPKKCIRQDVFQNQT